jgi:hypothetical protein
MTPPCSMEWIFGTLTVAVVLSFGTPAALAQSYAANGRIGYLGEWEMTGSLTRTANGASSDYTGPVTLRHVGLCSVNGAEEKSGVVQIRSQPKASAVEGTLALQDDNCHLVASRARAYSGVLNCRDGQGVPITFSIEPEAGQQAHREPER